jgi:hypothetical protein
VLRTQKGPTETPGALPWAIAAGCFPGKDAAKTPTIPYQCLLPGERRAKIPSCLERGPHQEWQQHRSQAVHRQAKSCFGYMDCLQLEALQGIATADWESVFSASCQEQKCSCAMYRQLNSLAGLGDDMKRR